MLCFEDGIGMQVKVSKGRVTNDTNEMKTTINYTKVGTGIRMSQDERE